MEDVFHTETAVRPYEKKGIKFSMVTNICYEDISALYNVQQPVRLLLASDKFTVLCRGD